MFKKILIANRGEIACRVIRTANKLGIKTVAVYSDADAVALHVMIADEAIHIGGSAPSESYLDMNRIIDVAKQTGAEAIHPGYGFLSENAVFCQLCADNDLVFIGPPVTAIETMGSKSAAKQIMESADVPLLPGYHGNDQDPALLKKAANEIGYPVLLKAVSGGGGKGMRQVLDPNDFDEALAAAKREASSSFGDDAMLVEKYLQQPRHVEVQVFCDAKGNGVYLFERDCSVQRRHQKIIEEAPAPMMQDGIREKMGETALRAARVVSYEGAGTVEFLLDSTGDFYFMEMNTRLQVEHPVTEMITGQDLVEWQLKIAMGEPLPCTQDQLTISGHSFEARIYAEDPDNDFLPAAGKLTWLQQPAESSHVRIDTGVIGGDDIGVFYDPMIAKLIVWDENREQALQRLDQALAAYRILGVTTNITFLRRLIALPGFVEKEPGTEFIERNKTSLFQVVDPCIESLVPLACLYLILRRHQEQHPRSIDPTSPWNAKDNWRMNAPRIFNETIIVAGDEYSISTEALSLSDYVITVGDYVTRVSGTLTGNELIATVDGHRQVAVIVDQNSCITLFSDMATLEFQVKRPDVGEEVSMDDNAGFKAPMNGTVIRILVAVGDRVIKGDTLVIMEAMKMEHAIKAPDPGIVSEIYFSEGDLVDGGADLISIKPSSTDS
ncbi:MAG: acetyl/propionyl/methylcrotonyl-CoA carboxylase subunit alpha [Gammaproteobacteria bacterium]|nr:acetyl/propionyl/methylcrotonyl-CoA carboxylase subunit alpha [Gammaproteobacteria bacterium]